MEMQRGNNAYTHKRPLDEILDHFDHDDLHAAKVLYELANGQCSYTNGNKAEKRKRESIEDGSKSKTKRKIKHSRAIQENRDQYLHNVDAPKLPKLPNEVSFSVIHLLSAVWFALVTPLRGGVSNLPLLNIDQIVARVRANPGDPLVLECEEPLVELVKGVLNIFLSQTLTIYDKSTKTWCWTGPQPYNLSSNKIETSHLSLGVSQENHIKLVNQFYLWWTKAQPTLHLIASLPEPPLELMQEKKFLTRFDDRKKMNQCTIGPSCDEIRAYFQREEAIRYSIPEKGFSYTTLDGKKSTAAPLRKQSGDDGKKYAKSRGHYIFKEERPPFFSLLSLVRDAAARLPGGKGTRADICSLIRDSQFIVDDIDETTVKQLVSGALDRLQSEVDPCVAYTGRSGLWVYLHSDRDELDFMENGTASARTRRVKSRASLDG